MADLFAYFKDLTVRTAEDFVTLQLDHLIDIHPSGGDKQLAFFHDWNGPENTTGTLVVTTPADEMPALEPPKVNQDRQTWFSMARGGAWLGYENDNPPGPSDLQRRHQFAGSNVTLGDGNGWLLAQFNVLPLRSAADPEGVALLSPTHSDVLANRLTGELLEFFADIREVNAMVNGERLCPPGCRTLAEHSMVKNYRGCWELFEKLGLFDTDPIVIAQTAMICTGLQAAAQKIARNQNRLHKPSMN